MSRKLVAPDAVAEQLSLQGDRLLSTNQAAALIGLSAKTLRQLRCDRQGPRCFKLGAAAQSRVLYRQSDLESWLSANVTRIGGR
jgi:predicted DNA-binding transcriptional regulator AlpA